MRRGVCRLMAAAAVLILTACGSDNNRNETMPDAITEENFESYFYSSGSGSLCERFGVYEYRGEFIFTADYFNCGNELLETHILSEEEKKLFLEEVSAVFSTDTKAADEESIDSDRDGAHIEYGSMVVDGNDYSVGMIDFKSVGIVIKDASKAEYPTEEESGKYELEGIVELQESAQWEAYNISVGSREFARSVGEQIEECLGEKMEEMVVDGLQDEDFTIKAETKKGDSYIVTVTYFGYVAETKKE